MGAPKFTPAGIRRAIQGVRLAGDQPSGVEVRPDGSFFIRIATGSEPALPSPSGEPEGNSCDKAFGG